MESTIIVAIFTGMVSIAVCLINNHYQMKTISQKNDAQMEDMIAHNEQAIAIMQCSIDELRKECEKHNNVMERVFVLEGRADKFCEITNNIKDDIKEIKDNVSKLTDKVHGL